MKLLKSSLVIVALATMPVIFAYNPQAKKTTASKASTAKKTPAAAKKTTAPKKTPAKAQTYTQLRNDIRTARNVMDRGLLSQSFASDIERKAMAAGIHPDLYKNLLQTARDQHAQFPASDDEARAMIINIDGQIESAVAKYAASMQQEEAL